MKSYIITLLSSSLTVSLSSLLLPEGNVKKYAKLVCSVLISLTVAMPLNLLKINFEEIEFIKDGEFALSREDAEKIYSDNLKEEIKKQTEEELGFLGRVYVTLGDECEIKLIEIYTDRALKEEEKNEIAEKYKPEKLEVYYGEN